MGKKVSLIGFLLLEYYWSLEGVQASEGCSLYTAPSTIPGAGLGIFSTSYFEEGDEVTPGDLVVPIIDFDFHSDSAYMLWNEYDWDGGE